MEWFPKSFEASTQPRNQIVFYPDHAAEMVVLYHHYLIPDMGLPSTVYAQWMQRHYREWLALLGKDHPWGLFAVLALQRGDMQMANCWLEKAIPFRNGTVWNIMDEAAFQIVEYKLNLHWPEGRPSCGAIR